MNGAEEPLYGAPYVPPPHSYVDVVYRILEKARHLPPLWDREYYRAAVPEYCHPLDMKGVWISQHFGENPATYKPLKGHDGIDYAVMTGGQVMCPSREQTVTDLILQKNSYGRHVWTIDEYGCRHIYGHLSEFLCEKGQKFTLGQVFALSGGGLEDPYRGFSSGPHLHWEVRPPWASNGNGYAGAENQESWITVTGVVPIVPPLPEPLYWLVVAADKLTIRSSANSSSWTNRLGYAYKGDRIPVYADNFLTGQLWINSSRSGNRFLCIRENTKTYLERLP